MVYDVSQLSLLSYTGGVRRLTYLPNQKHTQKPLKFDPFQPVDCSRHSRLCSG